MQPNELLLDELDGAACNQALAILVDVGIALTLECKTPGPDATLAERCKTYERVAVAVRRTILLFQHLKAGLAAPEIRHIQARKEIIRRVEDNIERNADPAEAAALRRELVERLDTPDFAVDLAARTPIALTRELCHDLGLTGVPGHLMHCRRNPGDIAILCAQAAAARPLKPPNHPR